MFSTPTSGTARFSPDEMKVSYWYVTHQLLLRRIMILSLALFDLLLVIFLMYGLVNYYFLSLPQTNAIYASLARPALNYAYLAELGQPQTVTISYVQVLPAGTNVYDVVAEVINPNTLWYGKTLTYHFEVGGIATEKKTDFLLPGQTKYIIEQAVKPEATIGIANVIIDDIRWEKVAHYDELQQKVLSFAVDGALFTPPQQSGATDATAVSKVNFGVTNQSAYNYANVALKVLLYRGQTLVGTNIITVDRFNSNERQGFEYLLYYRLLPATTVTVIPDVDILDSKNFLSFEGVGEVK